MPTIPAGYLEATFVYRRVGATRDSTFTMGFDDTDFIGHSPTTMATQIATAWSAAGRPAAAANMLVDWTFQGVSVTKQLESGPLIGQNIVPITGSIAQSALPSNCAVLVNKITGEGGRRNRGRIFLPPVFPSEGSVDAGGTILAGSVTALGGYIEAARVALLTAGYEMVLFHSEAPFTPTPITTLSVQSLLATQRRRMRR